MILWNFLSSVIHEKAVSDTMIASRRPSTPITAPAVYPQSSSSDPKSRCSAIWIWTPTLILGITHDR